MDSNDTKTSSWLQHYLTTELSLTFFSECKPQQKLNLRKNSNSIIVNKCQIQTLWDIPRSILPDEQLSGLVYLIVWIFYLVFNTHRLFQMHVNCSKGSLQLISCTICKTKMQIETVTFQVIQTLLVQGRQVAFASSEPYCQKISRFSFRFKDKVYRG